MKTRKIKFNYQSTYLMLLVMAVVFLTFTVSAQTTAFNFQGSLNDGANPANGSFEIQFKLFGAPSGGSQIGATVSRPGVAVINGIFTTQLDFGAAAFDGSARFIEIGVRPTGSTGAFSVLSPRQQVLSTPYATLAKNATQLGGLDANQYVTTSTVGNSFIRNAATQQTGNFNISGNGAIGTNLGVGIVPGGSYKLEVNGEGLFRLPGSGGNLQIGTPNSESGFSLISTNRADIRFDGTTLKLVVGPVGGPPPITNGIVIRSTGRVGIGLDLSNRGGKFQVGGGTDDGILATSNGNAITGEGQFGVTGNGTLYGIYGNSDGGTGVFGISRTGIGVIGTGSSFGVFSNGFIGMGSIGTGGSISICYNPTSKAISSCSSSLRYKTDLQPFGDGLSIINRLNPIAFRWKTDKLPDIGFGAEDVAKINPLFVTYNAQGEVEGVKYDRLSVVFVNAFKEQQAEIEKQRKQLDEQRLQIEALKKLICPEHQNDAFCQEK